MAPEQYAELFKNLGIAAPLVIVLLYLLRVLLQLLDGATEERKAVTDQFVAALTTTVTAGAASQQQAATALQDLAAAIHEGNSRGTDEHNRIVDALGKVLDRRRQSS